MVRTMDWKPNEELIAWGKEHLGAIPVDGIWSPEGSGVQYRKMGEHTFALMFMYNHPTSQEQHTKFKILMENCDYTVLEGDDVEMVTPALDPSRQMQDEYERKQAVAQGWACPECEYPLANSELEYRVDEFVETTEMELSNGEHAEIELWRCLSNCGGCGTVIPMEPDDYHLIAGDGLFMSWRSKDYRFTALTRGDMKDLADAGVQTGHVLGSKYDGQRVPPWMWGIYAIKTQLRESSEEE
jgi:hypothetical protein